MNPGPYKLGRPPKDAMERGLARARAALEEGTKRAPKERTKPVEAPVCAHAAFVAGVCTECGTPEVKEGRE